jgi:hypothetical protein
MAQITPGVGGATSVTSINNRIFADTQAGADGCAKINTAWTTVTSIGGAVVDGNGFQGTQNCSTNPFASITKTGRTELAGVFATTAAWTLNQGMIIKGTGRGNTGSPNYGGTAIRAVAGFPSSTAVVTAGGYGARLEDLTIDCNNQTGAIAYANSAGQEQTGLKNILALNCPGTTFNLSTSGAQNSGTYQDMEALYQIAGSAAAGSLCFNINGLTPLREVSGLTCNATGQGTAPTVGIQITSVSNGIIRGIHCEGVVTCINITTSNSVIIMDVQCTGATVVNCVVIGSGSQNVTVMNVSGGTNSLVDNMNSVAALTAPVGWYQTGSNGAAPGQCSSASIVPCTMYKGGLQLGGTVAFASLGAVPAAGIAKYCTDCTTAATCAGAGSGHAAISNGTNWTCQ